MLWGFLQRRNQIRSYPSPVSTSDNTSYRSCTHCGRKGHEISECFLLHGYPEWYQEQYQQSTTTTPGQNSQSSRGGRGGRSGGMCGRGRGRASHTTAAINSDQIASLITLLQNQQSNLTSERLSGKTILTDVILDT